MRRETRKKQRNMNILYVSGIVLGLAVIAFVITFIVYGNKLNKEAENSMLSSEKIADLVPSIEESREASSEFGKTVEESKEETEEVVNTPEPVVISNKVNATSGEEEIIEKEDTKEEKEEVVDKKEEMVQPETKVTGKIEEIKEPVFERPVEGEIIKKFAKDTLVYSETLDEWVVHNGVDIKADKTTVVKAAEEGLVKAIKNDPRYGLTIVIQHDMDYITVYSNLLTSEFVVESEKVEKGQSLGTVGNTATFEIADEPHLHFEIQKAGECVDPSNYIE